MRAVNLLPPDYASARRVSLGSKLGPLGDPIRLVPVAAALLLIGVVAVGYFTQSRAVSQRQDTLAEVQAELAARPKPAAVAAPTSEAGIRLAAAAAATSARVAWEEVMHQLSLVLPADVSLISLTAGAPAGAALPAADGAAPAPAPSGGGFTLTGYTVSQPAVARLMVQLEQAPTLSGVQLVSTARADRNGRPVIDFNISATVVPEGAGS